MTKPLSAYYWEKARQYHRARCKQCDKAAQRSAYQTNPHKRRAKYTPIPKNPRPCHRCGTIHTRNAGTNYCGKTCADAARDGMPVRNKHKSHLRRTRTRYSDLAQHDIKVMLTKAVTCLLCQSAMTTAAGQHQKHIDHIIPINIGGTHTKGNIRIICRTCNLARPDNGSDLDGHQPTIWACDQAAAQAASVLRRQSHKRRHARPPSRRSHIVKIKREVWTERARAAVIARRLGLQWQEIADTLGYASSGAAHNSIRLRLHLDPKNL